MPGRNWEVNKSELSIIADLVNHPGSSARDVSARIYLSAKSVQRYFNSSLKRYVRHTDRRHNGAKWRPFLYSVREGNDWCPRCGRIIE